MKTRILVAVGLLVLACSGCSSSRHGNASTGAPTTASSGAGGASTTAPASPSSGSTGTSSTSAPPAPGTSVPPGSAAGGPSPCATRALAGSLANPNGTAGSIYYSLILTNHGSATCVLQGYPGVSFVSGSGQQVGAAAARIAGTAPAVTLAPGASGAAVLQITDAGNYGTACRSTPTSGLRVYPPGQLSPLLIAHADRACANTADVTLHVGAFQPQP